MRGSSSDKTYLGGPDRAVVVHLPPNWLRDGSPDCDYELRHLVRHSPDGFSWGYAGSGPAELARCILLDYFEVVNFTVEEMDATVPPALYQAFKADVIATWPQNKGWSLSGATIKAWLDAHLP